MMKGYRRKGEKRERGIIATRKEYGSCVCWGRGEVHGGVSRRRRIQMSEKVPLKFAHSHGDILNFKHE